MKNKWTRLSLLEALPHAVQVKTRTGLVKAALIPDSRSQQMLIAIYESDGEVVGRRVGLKSVVNSLNRGDEFLTVSSL